MNSSPRRLLALVALLAACADFAPNNQADSRYKISIQINAPDTIHTYGDTIQLSLTSTPQWEGAPAIWSSTPFYAVQLLSGDRLVSNSVTYNPKTVTLTAQLGSHYAVRTIVLREVATRLRFWVWKGVLEFSDTAAVDADGDPLYVIPTLVDSGGRAIQIPQGTAYTVVSRNPNIAIWADSLAVPVHSGQTWFVGSLFGLVDSVLVIVP